MELLLELRRRRGMTVVVATHDMVVATRCEQVVRLLDGRIIDIVDVPPPSEVETLLDRITRMEP
jgi:putative ABC transport system ATP-binding protein